MAYLLDALTQENLDNQRDVVKNERRQGMDNVPYGRSMEMLFENLFPKGHPYSWHIIGKMEDLDNASRDDVKEFFRTYYTPNNCTLVIAGNFDSGRKPAASSRQLFRLYCPWASVGATGEVCRRTRIQSKVGGERPCSPRAALSHMAYGSVLRSRTTRRSIYCPMSFLKERTLDSTRGWSMTSR